jgi:hypothetical protein
MRANDLWLFFVKILIVFVLSGQDHLQGAGAIKVHDSA